MHKQDKKTGRFTPTLTNADKVFIYRICQEETFSTANKVDAIASHFHKRYSYDSILRWVRKAGKGIL